MTSMLRDLEPALTGLSCEKLYHRCLERLAWEGASAADRARCEALDLTALKRDLMHLWKRARRSWERGAYGALVYQLSPDYGWGNDVLLLYERGMYLLEDGRLNLSGGWEKVQGKTDTLMSAAYTDCLQSPGERAVIRLLAGVSLAAMREAVQREPVDEPVYAVVRDKAGYLKLWEGNTRRP